VATTPASKRCSPISSSKTVRTPASFRRPTDSASPSTNTADSGVIVISLSALEDADARIWEPRVIAATASAAGDPEAAALTLDEDEYLVEFEVPQETITFYIPPTFSR
jgi:hypothetical protein